MYNKLYCSKWRQNTTNTVRTRSGIQISLTTSNKSKVIFFITLEEKCTTFVKSGAPVLNNLSHKKYQHFQNVPIVFEDLQKNISKNSWNSQKKSLNIYEHFLKNFEDFSKLPGYFL